MEAEHRREQRRRLTTDDFDPLVIIGRGAFGEVGGCVPRWLNRWWWVLWGDAPVDQIDRRTVRIYTRRDILDLPKCLPRHIIT